MVDGESPIALAGPLREMLHRRSGDEQAGALQDHREASTPLRAGRGVHVPTRLETRKVTGPEGSTQQSKSCRGHHALSSGKKSSTEQ